MQVCDVCKSTDSVMTVVTGYANKRGELDMLCTPISDGMYNRADLCIKCRIEFGGAVSRKLDAMRSNAGKPREGADQMAKEQSNAPAAAQGNGMQQLDAILRTKEGCDAVQDAILAKYERAESASSAARPAGDGNSTAESIRSTLTLNEAKAKTSRANIVHTLLPHFGIDITKLLEAADRIQKYINDGSKNAHA